MGNKDVGSYVTGGKSDKWADFGANLQVQRLVVVCKTKESATFQHFC